MDKNKEMCVKCGVSIENLQGMINYTCPSCGYFGQFNQDKKDESLDKGVTNPLNNNKVAKDSFLFGIGGIFTGTVIWLVLSIILPIFGMELSMKLVLEQKNINGQPTLNIIGPVAIILCFTSIIVGIFLTLSSVLAWIGITQPAIFLLQFAEKIKMLKEEDIQEYK